MSVPSDKRREGGCVNPTGAGKASAHPGGINRIGVTYHSLAEGYPGIVIVPARCGRFGPWWRPGRSKSVQGELLGPALPVWAALWRTCHAVLL